MADVIDAMRIASQLPDYSRLLSDNLGPIKAQLNQFQALAEPTSRLGAVSQTMQALSRHLDLFKEPLLRPSVLEEFVTQQHKMQLLSDSILGPASKIHEAFGQQQAIFSELSHRVAAFDKVKLAIPDFAEATTAWNVATLGLASRMKDLGLLSERVALSARLFEAPKAYTEFVRLTTERLDVASEEAARRLRASMNLAELQLLDITDAVSGFVVVPEDLDEPDEPRLLHSPFVQQEELLNSSSFTEEADIESIAAASPAAQIVERARRVLELVIQCNEAGKTSALGIEVFKPTTRLMTVFSDLPWMHAEDRHRFGDVIDCLYFIFYEGAGRDNLRFLDSNGGPLDASDCDLIWCIKHLRNKWSRHDADHGKDREVQKSWSDLAAKWRWLGLTQHPTNTAQFQAVHLKLLEEAEKFLLRLLETLRL